VIMFNKKATYTRVAVVVMFLCIWLLCGLLFFKWEYYDRPREEAWLWAKILIFQGRFSEAMWYCQTAARYQHHHATSRLKDLQTRGFSPKAPEILPIDRFLKDTCILQTGRCVSEKELQEYFEKWCGNDERASRLRRSLESAISTVSSNVIYVKGSNGFADRKFRGWVGIGLKETLP